MCNCSSAPKPQNPSKTKSYLIFIFFVWNFLVLFFNLTSIESFSWLLLHFDRFSQSLGLQSSDVTESYILRDCSSHLLFHFFIKLLLKVMSIDEDKSSINNYDCNDINKEHSLTHACRSTHWDRNSSLFIEFDASFWHTLES